MFNFEIDTYEEQQRLVRADKARELVQTALGSEPGFRLMRLQCAKHMQDVVDIAAGPKLDAVRAWIFRHYDCDVSER